MGIITIDFDDFLHGSILPNGVYDSGSNINIGAKTSPFIVAKKDVTYTFKFIYDRDKLRKINGAWEFARVFTYDGNFEPISALGSFSMKISSITHEMTKKFSSDVRYIRFVCSHINDNAVTIDVSSDEPEKTEEPNGKTMLKLYANGDFHLADIQLIQFGGLGNYKFKKNTITVPKIIKYQPNNMPTWVKDTGCPVSLFAEGIVIKGVIL